MKNIKAYGNTNLHYHMYQVAHSILKSTIQMTDVWRENKRKHYIDILTFHITLEHQV